MILRIKGGNLNKEVLIEKGKKKNAIIQKSTNCAEEGEWIEVSKVGFVKRTHFHWSRWKKLYDYFGQFPSHQLPIKILWWGYMWNLELQDLK